MNTKCPRCNRPLAKSSDVWMNMAGSDQPELPQKKDYCGVVGDVFHGNALSSCEKWEAIFLRKKVKKLEILVFVFSIYIITSIIFYYLSF